jgi:hypothetical protein
MEAATILTTRPGGAAASLARLRALVLLGGAVRSGGLAASIGRPLFDLPQEGDCSILDAWRREAAQLAAHLGTQFLNVRVMIDVATPDPQSQPAQRADLSPAAIERDPSNYRGTGGVLHDLAADYSDNDLLLVANAAQVLLEPLTGLACDLAAAAADVSIISHEDGTASGMLLVRCGALRDLPATGFIDMKEQALPAIAASHRVAVVRRAIASAMPVRTLASYIDALVCHHDRLAGKPAAASAFAENWETSFALIEKGADVDPGARLHDSVVLGGGRVEAGAVLVHSVVCPGGVLRRGRMVIDDLVTPATRGRTWS